MRKYLNLNSIFLGILLINSICPVYASVPAKLIKINAEKLSATHAQLKLSLNQPVTYHIFALSNPSRLVIDLINTQYACAKNNQALPGTTVSLKSFRHGIQKGYNARLVFELSAHFHARVHTINYFPHAFYLMIDVLQKNSVTSANAAVLEKIKNNINFPEIRPAVNLPSLKFTSKIVKALPPFQQQPFVVVIDAGHGGKDPGAIGPQGTYEKNVTLAIAKNLAELVNQDPDMKAVLTRHDDRYIGLRQRLKKARKDKGDIFIAIHADAYNDTSAQGASVYALSLHGSSSEAALWLAKKENYSELGGIDLDNIDHLDDKDLQLRSVLIDLSQSATIGASLQLGRDALLELGEITQLHHNIVEQAPFMV